MLGVVEVDVHADGQHRDDDDVQQIFVIADLRQPAKLSGLVYDADLAGALGGFPDDDKIRDKLGRNVVHHEGEQRLIGVPFGLEDGRYKTPYRTGGDA